uniref:Integrase core domain containing protein n=1 Tax=Solanum tuberosum TaxID=4113 RepID=M1DRD6_SOLTU
MVIRRWSGAKERHTNQVDEQPFSLPIVPELRLRGQSLRQSKGTRATRPTLWAIKQPIAKRLHQRKNAAPYFSPTASQSEGDNATESSSSEVQIKTSMEKHPPQITRSYTLRAILQNTPSQSEEEVGPEAATRAHEEVGAEEEDHDVTPDDTMVQYVHLHEFDPVVRHQLIDCFRSMWTVNWSEDFFKNGIMNKSGDFKSRPLMPETRVVMADT